VCGGRSVRVLVVLCIQSATLPTLVHDKTL
jgi:hypothetical protein